MLSRKLKLDAGAFLLASATLSLEEIGALTILMTVCAGTGGFMACSQAGVPQTSALGAHMERLWPRISSYFIREGDRVLPDPRCPCLSDGVTRAKKMAKSGPEEWIGTIPLDLATPEFMSLWDEWRRFRRESLREPLTQRGGEIALGKCQKWGRALACTALQNAIVGRWKGLFEPRESPKAQGVPTSRFVPDYRRAEETRVDFAAIGKTLGSWKPPAV